MLHNCLAVVPVPGNPEILGLAGQIPWVRGSDNQNRQIENISPELLRTESEGEIWSQMVESIGEAPELDSMWVSVGDRGSDIFSYIRRVIALRWHCLLRVTQNRVITKPDGTKGYLKDESLCLVTNVFRNSCSGTKLLFLRAAKSPRIYPWGMRYTSLWVVFLTDALLERISNPLQDPCVPAKADSDYDKVTPQAEKVKKRHSSD